MNKLGPGVRRILELHLRDELCNCDTQEEKARTFSRYAVGMCPEDVQFFVLKFLKQPAKTQKPQKQPKRISTETYNKNHIGGYDFVSRMTADEYRDRVVEKSHKKAKLRHMNKNWRKQTLVSNKLLSDSLRAWAPQTGGLTKLKGWIRRVIRNWPIYGGECPYSFNGTKMPPSEYVVTATFEVCKFHDESRQKPPTFYKVYAMYDRYTDVYSALWSEYNKQSIADLPDTEIVVSEYYKDNKRQKTIEFTKVSGFKITRKKQ